MTNLDNILKSRDITLLTKVYLVKSMFITTDVSSSNLQMCELVHKEGWVLKNRCSQIEVLEKILESALNGKEIKPVNPKGNQAWIVIGRTDAEAEAPILWPPDGKSQLIGKDSDAGKTEGKRKRGQQRIRWWLVSPTQWTWIWANSGDSEGQGSLACCSPWDYKESDVT